MKKFVGLVTILTLLSALAYYLSLSKAPAPVGKTVAPESVETVTIESFEDCPEPAHTPCDPNDEMCQKEIRVLEGHCSWIERVDEDKLIVKLKNGEQKEYVNRETDDLEEPDEFVAYQVEDYQKDTGFLVIFAAQVEFYNRIVLNLQTGAEVTVAGEVTWSPDGKYFVATNEDWHAAYTPNEVKIFYCGDPQVACRQIYSRDDVGGKGAEWLNADLVRIVTTTEEVVNDETMEHREVLLNCSCTPETCSCEK